MVAFRNFVLIVLLCSFIQCSSSDDDQLYCTMEFRSVSITVNGPVLDHYHTVRVSNGDIIAINEDPLSDFNNTYTVLNDNYLNLIINSTEVFVFKGFINNELVVNEAFTISGDRCHINYVSGNTIINLQ